MCRESAKNPHITARNECYFSQYQIGDILIYRGMVWINQYFLQYLNQKAHLAPSPLFLSYLHLHIFIYIHIVYIYIYIYINYSRTIILSRLCLKVILYIHVVIL